jgi:hypothetical protein
MTARRPGRDAGAVAKTAAALKLERKLERRRKGPRGGKVKSGMAYLRLAEIQRLIRHRHDGPCDTDDGSIYLKAALPCLLNVNAGSIAPENLDAVLAWQAVWTPRVPEVEAREMVEDLWRRAHARERIHLKADAVARLLGVRMAERACIGLCTIGATDKTKAERTAMRKAAKAERERKRREKAGATPHARSKTALKPWEDAGISRASWYRQKARETNTCPQVIPIQAGTDLSQSTGYTPAAGPASIDSASQSRSAGGHSPRGKTMEAQASQSGTLPLSGDEVRSNGGSHRKEHRPPKVALSVREAMRSTKGPQAAPAPIQQHPTPRKRKHVASSRL